MKLKNTTLTQVGGAIQLHIANMYYRAYRQIIISVPTDWPFHEDQRQDVISFCVLERMVIRFHVKTMYNLIDCVKPAVAAETNSLE